MRRIESKMKVFEKDLLNMAYRTKMSMVTSIDALQSFDKEEALGVIETDEYINYMEESINVQAIEILTLMQPLAKDLRLILGGIKIANDLERIADYSKNISRFVIKEEGLDPKTLEEFVDLSKFFLMFFTKVIYLIENRDVKKAYSLSLLDDELDIKSDLFIQNLAIVKAQKERFPVEISNMARNIERAGDHAKNITEHIIYIEKGQHIDFG